MALSNEEQRLLEQMEAALAAEDPKLVNAMRGTGTRRVHRRRAALAGVAFFGGLVLLIVGLYLATDARGYIALSVLGFVLMVAAAVIAILSWQHVGSAVEAGDRPDRAKTVQGSRAPGNQGFMDKMEERWRKRRDEGM
jgi:VIT1/CCC1 family predicted Fe2+/Mn2+ transporter